MKRKVAVVVPPSLDDTAIELYAAARHAQAAEGLEAVCAAHRRWVIAQMNFDRAVEAEIAWRKRAALRREEREASR